MKSNAKMQFQSWKTTDEEGSAKRRERPAAETKKGRGGDARDGGGG